MFGFYRCSAKHETASDADEQDVVNNDGQVDDSKIRESSGADRTRLAWIYVMFFAEAIMASSLQPQLELLDSSNEQVYCRSLSSAYLVSILDGAYALGAVAGILWGYLADRIGRRTVVLAGLYGMSACCLSMGFATDLLACTVLRFVAGIVSSAVAVGTLAMLGDVSLSVEERMANVSRLPLVGACGAVGPLIQGIAAGYVNGRGAVWERYPMLSRQIACGVLVLAIAMAATFVADETLLHLPGTNDDECDVDCEKAAFLASKMTDDCRDAPSICVVDCVRPEPISISVFLQAPSLIVLMCSFCLLSLHASSFDVVLPHLGHSSSRDGGMGLSCHWLGLPLLAVRAIAGALILHTTPKMVEKWGLLRPFRSCALAFPALYIVTPLLAFAATCSTQLTAVIASAVVMIKHLLAGGAQVLVTLLMLNTAPDAFSVGTVIGLMQTASLFKALAVAVSGASLSLSDAFSLSTTNYALWASLVVFGAVGAAVAWFVRERPSVERDFPADALCWETCFDADGHVTSTEADR